MRIILDNEEKQFNIEHRDSLDIFIRGLTSEVEALGRIITSMKFDGTDLENLTVFNLHSIELIEVTTERPNLLLMETLSELEAYIDKFLVTIDYMIRDIENGEVLEAIENLLDGINGLEWIFSVLENTEEMLYLQEGELDLLFERANIIMKSLIEALEAKSYDDIKTELSFNLYSLLIEIKGKIPALSQRAIDIEQSERMVN